MCSFLGTDIDPTFVKQLRVKGWKIFFKPLTHKSDQDRNSPYNIDTISCRQEMRINTNINLGIIGWSKTKFSQPMSQELYSRQLGELL